MGRKCVQVDVKLSATYAINQINYNELATLIATSASFAKSHYKYTIAMQRRRERGFEGFGRTPFQTSICFKIANYLSNLNTKRFQV